MCIPILKISLNFVGNISTPFNFVSRSPTHEKSEGHADAVLE